MVRFSLNPVADDGRGGVVMVKSVASLTRSGLNDWLIQRVTAVYLAVGIIALVVYVVMHPAIDYDGWQQLFTHEVVRIATLLFFISLALHAWAGLWMVITDYLKCPYSRFSLYIVIFCVLFGAVVWSAAILWGQ